MIILKAIEFKSRVTNVEATVALPLNIAASEIGL